ncbi:MAG TPA: condensation domain-containing protein, partial [Thermoanaerobaculia bacterium]|nr:condensation domain-containing protein [Thermoanaerobaculia bacterium]
SPALGEALRALGRREGVTLFMTLLAAWAALLHGSSGQDEVVIGSPVANRGRLEIEPLLGCFVNMLPLRLAVAGNPPFRALLGQAREVALAAYAHQELPFERLVDELKVERRRDRNPLFQAAFALQNTPLPPLALPGMTLEPLAEEEGVAKFDLNLVVVERGAELAGALIYATDLFDAPAAARLGRRYAALLAAFAADPERGILDPLPGEEESAAERVESPRVAALRAEEFQF